MSQISAILALCRLNNVEVHRLPGGAATGYLLTKNGRQATLDTGTVPAVIRWYQREITIEELIDYLNRPKAKAPEDSPRNALPPVRMEPLPPPSPTRDGG